MSAKRSRDNGCLTPSVAQRVDEVCDRFEDALVANNQARIEGYVEALPEPERTILLRELLLLEIEYRHKAGEIPTQEEYGRRFPGQGGLIEAVFAKIPSPSFHGDAGARPTAPRVPAADTGVHSEQTGPEIPRQQLESSHLPQGGKPDLPAVPGYELLDELGAGKGGMGKVYKAWDVKLRRLVALKMIKAGPHARPEDIARFRFETQAVARLQHPNVVQIFEVGDHNGHPYCSLEFLDGGDLATKLAGTPQPTREAAQMVETLARAMHCAHQRSIVHRDLKPANVLLTAEGSPKIADFGLAKRLEGGTGQTLPGVIMGSPSYMAFEQAAGKNKEVGPAADVYGLGAILYEMLTGRPPFKGATIYDTILQVLHEQPVPPRQLQPKVPLDLESVCLACLEKDASRRYSSAEALANDLRAFLNARPTQRRPPGYAGLFGRWCRRNPILATAATVIFLTVVTAFALILQSRNEERKQRENFQLMLALADFDRGLSLCEKGQVAQGLLWLARSQALAPDGATELRRLCRANLGAWRGRLLGALRFQLPHEDEVLAVAFSPDGRTIATGSKDGTACLWDAVTGRRLEPVMKDEAGRAVLAVAFSPDGKIVLTGVGDLTLLHNREVSLLRQPGLPELPLGGTRRWDAATRKLIGNHSLPFAGPVWALAFSPDGRTFLTGSGLVKQTHVGENDGSLSRFGGLTRPFGGPPSAVITRSNPLRGFAAFDVTTPIQLWDAANGLAVNSLGFDIHRAIHFSGFHAHQEPDAVLAVAFSPDGRFILSGSADGHAELWDATKQQSIAFLAGGSEADSQLPERLFPGNAEWTSRSHPRLLLLQNLRSPFRVADLSQHPILDRYEAARRHPASAVAFNPDGRSFVIARSNSVKQWDAATLQAIGPPLSSRVGIIRAVAFSPDGRNILTARGTANTFLLNAGPTLPGEVEFWDQASGSPLDLRLQHEEPLSALACSPDGRTVLTGGRDKTARLWEVATGLPIAKALRFHDRILAFAFSPDGKSILTGSEDTTARLWETSTGKPLSPPLRHSGPVRAVAFSPDGNNFLTSSGKTNFGPGFVRRQGQEGEVRLWETATGRAVADFKELENTKFGPPVFFSSDSRVVLTQEEIGGKVSVRVWQVAAGKPVFQAEYQAANLVAAMSPDGRVCIDEFSQLWDTATWKELCTLQPRRPGQKSWPTSLGSINHVAFSPDSRTVVTANEDNTSRQLWDVSTGTRFGQPVQHLHTILALAFSPDSRIILTGSTDQTARLWEAATGKPLGTSLVHRGPVNAVALSRDGTMALTGSGDKTARLWDTATRKPIGPPLEHKLAVSAVAFGADNQTVLTLSGEGTAQIWKLHAPLEGEAKQIAIWAQLITGKELDDASLVHNLDAKTWQDRRRQLDELGGFPAGDQNGSGQQHGTEEVLDWHQHEADSCEARGQWFGAAWHFHDLIKADPADGQLRARRGAAYTRLQEWEKAVTDLTKAIEASADSAKTRMDRGEAYLGLQEREKAILDLSKAIERDGNAWQAWLPRGQAYAGLGQWQRASADFARGLDLGEASSMTSYCHALVLLQLRDTKGYQVACSTFFNRFQNSPDLQDTHALLRTCVLGPDALADPQQLVVLAERTAARRPTQRALRSTLGAALYRAGRFEAAIQELDAAMKAQGGERTLLDRFFVAMAHARLGYVDKARAFLNDAVQQLEQTTKGKAQGARAEEPPPWDARLALELLRGEAEAVLRAAKP